MKSEQCHDCGRQFLSKHGNKKYCKDCYSNHRFATAPDPVYKGVCVCWYDGLDYMVHECDVRRKLARKRLEEGKPYQMPQCLDCFPGRPEVIIRNFRCSYCGKEFLPSKKNKSACSDECRIKRNNNSAKSRQKSKKKGRKNNERTSKTGMS